MKKRNLVLFGSAAMLSLALAGSIGAVTAFADQTLSSGGTTSGQTTVTYTQADSWTVTIPDTINIASPDAANDKVSATNVKIAEGDKLTVTVTSKNGWHLKQGDTGTGLEYELKADSGEALTDGGTVLTVEAGTTTGEAALTATLKGTASNYSTGNEAYTDELTFNVNVDAAGD